MQCKDCGHAPHHAPGSGRVGCPEWIDNGWTRHGCHCTADSAAALAEQRRESNRRNRDGRGRFIPSNGGGYGYGGGSAFDRISAERARRWLESGS